MTWWQYGVVILMGWFALTFLVILFFNGCAKLRALEVAGKLAERGHRTEDIAKVIQLPKSIY